MTLIAVTPIFLLPAPTQHSQQKVSSTSIPLNQLTQGPESHLNPSYSPNGQQIVFSENTSGHFQIWVMDSSGSDLVQLTSFSSNQLHPEWNPSGNQIAFLSIGSSSSTIMVLNILTKQLSKLCDSSCSNDTTFAWSPSGSYIVFNAFVGDKSEIFVADTSTWKVSQLTQVGQDDNLYPTWSVDSQWIIFSSNTTGNYAIYEMSLDGSELHQISLGTGNDFAPIMSPNGEFIAFTCNESDQMAMWLVTSNGSSQFPVQSNPLKQKPGLAYSPPVSEDTYAAWRPDGKELLFYTTTDQLMAFYIGVMVVNYNGAGRGIVQLGNSLIAAPTNQTTIIQPSWQPDGAGIIYASNQTGNYEIYTQVFNSTSPNPYG